MKKIFLVIISLFVFCSCESEQTDNHHYEYFVGNEKELEAVNLHIAAMSVLGRYPDTMSLCSYEPIFPAIFGKTDYNAVKYHRKYVDTIVLGDHLSEVYYDFFYLIDQNICLDIPEYLEFIDEKYTKKYRD